MPTLTVPKPSPTKNKTVFFPNLDGLRAIAAFLVIISHVEPLKEKVKLARLTSVDLAPLGKIGVGIFFVLSGFLITYLLLEERKSIKAIDYKKFYIRRVLRIWPLYFLVLGVGYFIYPTFNSREGFWLSVFFLANVAFVMDTLPALIAPIWSIGVEEQFYIFQPQLIRIKRIRHILLATVFFIILFWITDLLVGWPADQSSPQLYVKRFLSFARFDSMLIGSVFAMLLFRKTTMQQSYPLVWNVLTSPLIQIAVLLAFTLYITLIVFFRFPVIQQVIALLSAVVIINLAHTKSSVLSLQHPFLMKAGKISYGLYLLHKFVILGILYLAVTYFDAENRLIDNVLIYGLSLVGSYFLAHTIYYNYEIYFMRLKSKFGIIYKENHTNTDRQTS